VQWIGIAEKNHNRGLYVAEKIGADFVTHDHRELLKRPEVTTSLRPTSISTSSQSWRRSSAACRC
jgi:hypothetical protein